MIHLPRNLIALSVAFATLGLTACQSFGGSSDFQGRPSGGVGALVSQLEPRTSDVDGVSVDESISGGAGVLIGYDINPRFSVEGHYSTLGEASFDPAGSIDYQVGGLSALVYGLSSEENRARREGFSVFGRLGAGIMENEATGIEFERVNDYHLLAGAGAEYGMGNGIGFRLEAVSHDVDALYGQLAVLVRFGGQKNRSNGPRAVPQPAPTPSTEVTTAKTDSLVVTDATPLDSDSDGIPDTKDSCNDTATDTPVGIDGCAYFDGVIEGISFASGSDVLTLEARGLLGQVVDVLISYPKAKITIASHTDDQGPSSENLMLSKRRAIAVTRFLVEQGIDGSRLAPKAYGETKPRASNDTPEGRASNRRVEFFLVR